MPAPSRGRSRAARGRRAASRRGRAPRRRAPPGSARAAPPAGLRRSARAHAASAASVSGTVARMIWCWRTRYSGQSSSQARVIDERRVGARERARRGGRASARSRALAVSAQWTALIFGGRSAGSGRLMSSPPPKSSTLSSSSSSVRESVQGVDHGVRELGGVDVPLLRCCLTWSAFAIALWLSRRPVSRANILASACAVNRASATPRRRVRARPVRFPFRSYSSAAVVRAASASSGRPARASTSARSQSASRACSEQVGRLADPTASRARASAGSSSPRRARIFARAVRQSTCENTSSAAAASRSRG